MKQVHLGLLLRPIGVHIAAWRRPNSNPRASMDLRHYVEIAQAAEAAKLDMLFMPDNSFVNLAVPSSFERTAAQADSFEPLTLLSALAALTERIGLVGTVSATQFSPHQIARMVLSFDHLSSGRAGWNAVTSPNHQEQRVIADDVPAQVEDRYAWARETLEIVTGLWDGWAPDAIVADTEAGLYIDAERLTPLDYSGRYWKTQGVLNAPRSPQGRPVIAQAGASEEGRDLAAHSADIVFAIAPDIDKAKSFYDDIKSRARAYGRDPDSIKIMPGLQPIIAGSRSEAEELQNDLISRIPVASGLAMLSQMLGGIDLSPYGVDEPVPDLVIERGRGSSGHVRTLLERARRDSLTIRQLYGVAAGARGHLQVVGTPQDVADMILTWVDAGACDGFVTMLPSIADCLRPFTEEVVPLLRAAGRFREDYAGTTIRDHLGIGAAQPLKLS